MSLFDSLKSQLKDALGSSPEAAAAAANPGLMSGILDMLQKQGLASLVEKFKEHGLSQVVHSWIGKGENLPISADMLHKVLSPETIEAIAQKAGIPAGQATALLAKILPSLVDKMTPDGLLEEPPTNP